MNTSSNINNLFNASACLSPEALEKYAGKQLSASDMRVVEEHIAGCPFCKDALEGASQLPGFAAHSSTINERLRRRFRYIPDKASRKGPILSNFFIPAAASVIVLAGIIAWFHYFYPEKQELALVLDTIHVQTEELEIQEKAQATTEAENTHESTLVGGVFKEEEGISEAPPTEQDADPVEEEIRESPATIVVVEDEALTEDAGVDELYADAEKSEVMDEENTEVVVMEEKAGAGNTELNGVSAKKSLAATRQKESQDMTFSVVEQMPEYPGGTDSLQSFLFRNLAYPKDIEQKTDTTVIASFVISKKGKIKNINIVSSAGKAFDEEVIRVIRLMPEWIPAQQRGKHVAVKYNLPVRFKTN